MGIGIIKYSHLRFGVRGIGPAKIGILAKAWDLIVGVEASKSLGLGIC